MAKKIELKVVGKGYGYRNVTEGGGGRRPVSSMEKAKEYIAEARANSPHIVFEMIEFDIVEDTEIVWRQGQGRAGNSFPTKNKIKRWVPRYDRVVKEV